jgi:hypothetical protein
MSHSSSAKNLEYAPGTELPCDNADVSCQIDLIEDDVVEFENDSTRVVFATLYSYADEKDDSEFQKIYLPPICVNALELYNMFYQTKLKRFNPFVLNKLISSVGKPALVDAVLTHYESVTGNARTTLSGRKQIMLQQDFDLKNINSRIQQIVHMDNEDFEASLLNEMMWFNEIDAVAAVAADPSTTPPTAAVLEVVGSRNIRTSVEIYLYSELLQQGLILIVQFIAHHTDEQVFEGPFSSGKPSYELATNSTYIPKCDLCVTYRPDEESA